jgi:hypothetical protein
MLSANEALARMALRPGAQMLASAETDLKRNRLWLFAEKQGGIN